MIINDTAPDYSNLKISDFEEKYIILCLAETIPDIYSISMEYILECPYSITRVRDSIIDTKLTSKLDYWDGTGAYWIVFLVPDNKMSKITAGYISKEAHDVSQKVIYASNDDFMKVIYEEIDVENPVYKNDTQ